MKFVDEFRDGALARVLAGKLKRAVQPGRRYNFMEFCGGHTHAISRYGVSDLLPENVNIWCTASGARVRKPDRANRQRDRASRATTR